MSNILSSVLPNMVLVFQQQRKKHAGSERQIQFNSLFIL